MSTEKLKVPLKEDGRFVLDYERCYRKKRSRKIQIWVGVCFLLALNISLFIFTMITLRKLQSEIDRLKNTLSDIKRLDDSFINLIVGDETEDEDFYEEDQDVPLDPGVFIGNVDFNPDYLDYNYDQLAPNETDEANRDEGKKFNDNKSAVNLTKQGKESFRKKRNVIAATQDGVLINSESYAERRIRNNTRHRNHPMTGSSVTPVTTRPSYFSPTPWTTSRQYSPNDYTAIPRATPRRREHIRHSTRTPPSVYIRRSRVMHTEEKSSPQAVKKASLKSGDTLNSYEEGSAETEFTVVRERRPRMGRVRLPTVHYSGDTSKYVVGQHTNFNGNGHLKHPQSTFVDWKISDWVKSVGMDTHFTMDEGVVTIKEPGIYFIYAQVYYLDEHDLVGFRVHRNNEMILQCTITIHSTERKLKGNTCYTAGVEYLAEGDTISLGDVSRERYSLFEPGKSFFGLIKLGDVKIK